MAGLGKAARMRFTLQQGRGHMNGEAPVRAYMGGREAAAAQLAQVLRLRMRTQAALGFMRVRAGAAHAHSRLRWASCALMP